MRSLSYLCVQKYMSPICSKQQEIWWESGSGGVSPYSAVATHSWGFALKTDIPPLTNIQWGMGHPRPIIMIIVFQSHILTNRSNSYSASHSDIASMGMYILWNWILYLNRKHVYYYFEIMIKIWHPQYICVKPVCFIQGTHKKQRWGDADSGIPQHPNRSSSVWSQ